MKRTKVKLAMVIGLRACEVSMIRAVVGGPRRCELICWATNGELRFARRRMNVVPPDESGTSTQLPRIPMCHDRRRRGGLFRRVRESSSGLGDLWMAS